jgi:hypothetical protein
LVAVLRQRAIRIAAKLRIAIDIGVLRRNGTDLEEIWLEANL